MNYTHTLQDDVLKIKIKGDLLGASSELELLSVIDNYLQEEVSFCAVDISEVVYMNSSGLNILIKCLTRFRNAGGELVLVNPSEHVKKLLVITKLSAIFKIANSDGEAYQLLHTVETE